MKHHLNVVIQVLRITDTSECHKGTTCVGQENRHSKKSHNHTIQRTCLSSHLPVGLGVFPHSLLLERQMEACEIWQSEPHSTVISHGFRSSYGSYGNVLRTNTQLSEEPTHSSLHRKVCSIARYICFCSSYHLAFRR